MNVFTLLADLVVIVHLGYVLFVICGLLAILLGYLLRWNWIRNLWFRCIHLGMISIVVVESLLSITCPLTTLENYLRWQGGQAMSSGSFVGRIAHELLFYNLTPENFTALYCGFGALVACSWLLIPPRPIGKDRGQKEENRGGET